MEVDKIQFYIKQIETGCLSHYAYYVESAKQAMVIDPLRDIKQYMDLASSRGAQIKYVACTHIHADFVSGYWDLAKKTGAEIVLGPTDEIAFKHIRADDGKIIVLGNVELQVIHTPGHTLESICLLLVNKNEGNIQEALFTGDTLFVGDVGRPDLAAKGSQVTKRDLTDHLFDSLRKLMQLSHDCIILPGHGAGSACGKNLGKESHSTIGIQKTSNYALKIEEKEEFYKALVTDLPTPPAYFFYDVNMNLHNNEIKAFDEILETGKKPLTPQTIKELSSNPDYIIIDTRDTQAFTKAHVPGAVNIPIKGSVAVWTATIVEPSIKLLLVCDLEHLEESITRLSRTGMDNTEGYLEGGIQNWIDLGYPTESIEGLKPVEIENLRNTDVNSMLLDVRNCSELSEGVLVDSTFLNLSFINKNAEEVLAKHRNMVVVCKSGARAVIACSLLKRKGYNVRFVEGGFIAAKEQGLEVIMPNIKNIEI